MAATHPWDNLVHDMREEFHDLANINTVTAARQAFLAMWATFILLPAVFGLDKIFGFMYDGWDRFVAVWADNLLPGSTSDAILWVGIVEVLLAIVVAVAPHAGGDLLGAFYVLLAIDLFGVSGQAYLALGMLALAVCSFAMGRMARGDHIREA